MVNKKREKQQPLKGCYGTNEWSENSGICRNCKLKDECGKTRKNQKD